MERSDKTPQLVNELFVSDLNRSIAFYTSLGFTLHRKDDHFAALHWDGSFLFLDERKDLQPDNNQRMNIRIMVPDTDIHWQKAQEAGIKIYQPIADRYYGLRDFTISDPDGFGIRFATIIN